MMISIPSILALAGIFLLVLESTRAEILNEHGFTLTSNVIPLARRFSQPHSSPSIIPSKVKSRSLGPVTLLDAVDHSQFLVANVTFGNHSFELIVDITSSDTWVIAGDFQCLDADSHTLVNQNECSFGPSYTPSSTFQLVTNENLNVTYSGGQYVTGYVATETVTLGYVTVNNQTIGLVHEAAWDGDGSTSGVLGLAYPHRTSIFKGSDARVDTLDDRVLYNPLFTNMWKQNSIPAKFSLAIYRNSPDMTEAGCLALGGIPPLPILPPYISTPIVTAFGWRAGDPVMYSMIIDGMTYEKDTTADGSSETLANNTRYQALLDTTLDGFYLPSPQAYAINSLFQPPAQFDSTLGGFWVDCDSIPPKLGFNISGGIYFMDQRDLIKDNGDGSCQSAVHAIDAPGYGVLGLRFYWNTLVFHDVGAGVIRLAARVY